MFPVNIDFNQFNIDNYFLQMDGTTMRGGDDASFTVFSYSLMNTLSPLNAIFQSISFKTWMGEVGILWWLVSEKKSLLFFNCEKYSRLNNKP